MLQYELTGAQVHIHGGAIDLYEDIPENTPDPQAYAAAIVADLESTIQPPPVDIYLHVDLADGDGRVPIGLKNDGSNWIQVVTAFREGPDPASAVLPISGAWRVEIRDHKGDIYDIILVTLRPGNPRSATPPPARPPSVTWRNRTLTSLR